MSKRRRALRTNGNKNPGPKKGGAVERRQVLLKRSKTERRIFIRFSAPKLSARGKSRSPKGLKKVKLLKRDRMDLASMARLVLRGPTSLLDDVVTPEDVAVGTSNDEGYVVVYETEEVEIYRRTHDIMNDQDRDSGDDGVPDPDER